MASRFSARPAFLPEPPSTRARALPSDDWERCGVCAHDLAATRDGGQIVEIADKGDSVDRWVRQIRNVGRHSRCSASRYGDRRPDRRTRQRGRLAPGIPRDRRWRHERKGCVRRLGNGGWTCCESRDGRRRRDRFRRRQADLDGRRAGRGARDAEAESILDRRPHRCRRGLSHPASPPPGGTRSRLAGIGLSRWHGCGADYRRPL